MGEGKKIGANDAVYHRFPPPAWGTQGLLSGSWPVIEVSDSPNGSQNSSMIWPYLIWTGLLLNIDRVSSGWGLSPGIQWEETDTIGFAGLIAFLDPYLILCLSLACYPQSLTFYMHVSCDFMLLLFPSVWCLHRSPRRIRSHHTFSLTWPFSQWVGNV